MILKPYECLWFALCQRLRITNVWILSLAILAKETEIYYWQIKENGRKISLVQFIIMILNTI